MDIGGRSIKLQIWDTAGQERFQSITSNYYHGSHAIAIVYDITDRQSYEDVRRWYNDVRRLANPNVCVLLVGNKTDLEDKRVVSYEEGQMMADTFGCPFIETSAKSTQNVQAMFNQMCQAITKRQDAEKRSKGDMPSGPALTRGNVVQNNGCSC